MSSREDVLARVRKNQPAARPLPQIPAFVRDYPAPLIAFKVNLLRMGGKFADAPSGETLEAMIARLFPSAKVVCSATPEVAGNRPIAEVHAPQQLDDVDVGVVRAAYGVIETGSVWLSDTALQVNALAFLAQHLVVLLDPARLLPDLHDAYKLSANFDTAYGVLMTGPTATADIEGVLIHGAQGIRSLTVIPVADSA